MLTFSKEDYLKEIYYLTSERDSKVSTSFIADRLSVSNAAVSEMSKKLKAQGFIKYEKYKGVELTEKGRKFALQMVRRHRLWETFLTETLGLGWNEVHDEAEILEHHTSEFITDKIDEYLGYPKFDPHGDPIPTKTGLFPKARNIIKLSDAETNQVYNIARVNHEDKELMNYFTDLGIEINKEIVVLDRLNYDNSILVLINDEKVYLSEMISSKLYVLKKETEKNGR